MPRKTNDFLTVRSEGGLLPPDLLRRIIDAHSSCPGHGRKTTTRCTCAQSPNSRLTAQATAQADSENLAFSGVSRHTFATATGSIPQVQP